MCDASGIVQSVDNGNATINFMSRSGKYFIWPNKPYVQTLPFNELLCTMDDAPIAVSKTRFQFNDTERIDTIMAQALDD
jgi:hypothetical protein